MTNGFTETLDATLAHFGIPGMKWGQHKGPVSASGYANKGVIRTEGSTMTPKQHNALAELAHNAHITSANVKPKFVSDLSAINKRYDPSKFAKDGAFYDKYRSEVRRMYEKHVDATLPAGLHTQVMAHPDRRMPMYVVIGNKAGVALETSLLRGEGFSHSAATSDAVRCLLEETLDSSGLITGMDFSNELEQSDLSMIDEVFGETLSHYGIPGMKWGHRKSRGPSVSAPSGPEPVTIKQNRKGNLETAGGRGHNPSEDALSAVALRQKAHASGTHSLSNHELSQLVARMNLESNYQKAIVAGTIPKKKNFLEKFVEGEKNMLISGKKPKTAQLVETIIKTQRAQAVKAAATAAAKTAVKVAV
jgi:hypothetical protein